VPGLIVSREELEASLAVLRADVADPRAGILGPDSIGWRIGADLALFLGGGRAALLQLAHPFVAHAIEQHSRTRADVVGRFQRTFRNVFAMVFGDLDDAFAAARRVHTIHTRVHGTLPIAVGPYAAGTPYHANHVDALRWVHATLVDTTIHVRELIDGRPLEVSIKDAYMIELHRFGALFGIPSSSLPASWAEHVRYVEEMIASQLAVAPCAREMAGFLIGRGGAQPLLGRTAELVTHAMLPPWLAAELGLRGAPRSTRIALAAFAGLYRRIPRDVVMIPACADAKRRLAGRKPSSWSVVNPAPGRCGRSASCSGSHVARLETRNPSQPATKVVRLGGSDSRLRGCDSLQQDSRLHRTRVIDCNDTSAISIATSHVPSLRRRMRHRRPR
jgi:uncharacterized protein (DUF2236 family)